MKKQTALTPFVASIPSRSHSSCLSCGLFTTGCRTPFMKANGPHGGIMVIGEAPGHQEDDQGRAFVGASGRMIRSALSKRGIDPSRIRWTNAVRCRPPKNKIKPKFVKSCRPFVETDIRETMPQIILLVGNSALLAVTKRGGILKQRRTILHYTFLNDNGVQTSIPCIACLHPAYIMRSRDMLPEFERDLDFFADMARNVSEQSGATIEIISTPADKKTAVVDLAKTVPVEINPTITDLQDFASDVRKHLSPVGYDTETDTLRPYVEKNFALLCIGLSSRRTTLVIPCDKPEGNTIDGRTLYFHGLDGEVEQTKAKLKIVRDILTDPTIPKVAHSAKYDHHVVNVRLKKRVQNLWVDTRVLHTFLYSIEGVAHDLDSVMADVLGAWKYKHITAAWVGENETNPKKFRTVPYDKLALRNGLDCYTCVECVAPLLKQLAAWGRKWQRIAPIKRISPEELFHKLMMPCLSDLADTEARGMQINKEYVDAFRKELDVERRQALKTLRSLPQTRAFEAERRQEVLLAASEQKRYPKPEVIKKRLLEARFNPNSRQQIGKILTTKCGFDADALDRVIQRTDSNEIATGEEAMAAYIAFASKQNNMDTVTWLENVRVYGAAEKGIGTFIDGMLEYVDSDNRVHTNFNMDVTRTGRLSSSDPNLQNIPIRGREGKDDPRYRRMYTARPGCKLISADYSQVELRVLAAFGRDKVMIDIFNSGRDLHTETARRAFGLPPDVEVDKFKRRAAKTVNFGVVYQQSVGSLALQLGVAESEAASVMNAVMGQFRGAVEWIAFIKAFARQHGVVFTWFGRPRPLGNAQLQGNDGGLISAAERRAVNTPVQGTANEICLIAYKALARYFAKQPYYCAPVGLVHDQVLLECDARDDYMAHAIAATRKISIDAPMKALGPEFIVPLVVDISIGDNWGDLKDI